MARVTSIFVNIGANTDGFKKEITGLQKTLNASLGKGGMGFSKAAVGVLAGISAGLGLVGFSAVKSAAGMEMTRTAFTQMLGSAEKAESFIKDLQKFAASTPFEFEQVKGAAQKFLAFGFTAEQVIPVLTSVGNAAAGLGMGQDGIDRLTLAMGQMAAKGKVSGEEMRQLAEAGIPAWQMLADKMGVTIPEAMDKVSKGGVSAAVGLDALVSGMDSKFGGMMEQMSQSMTGLWSTLSDNAGIALIAIGESLTENLGLKEILKSLGDMTTEFTTTLQSSGMAEALRTLIPPELEIAIYAVAAALTVAMIPAVFNFGLSLTATALSAVAAFTTGLGLLSQGITIAMGAFASISAAMSGFGALAMMTTANLSGLPLVLGLIRFGLMALWAALGPLGLAIIAVSAAVVYMMSSGTSLTGILQKMGISSSSLNGVISALTTAWDHLWGTLKLIFSAVTAILKLFGMLAVVAGTILLGALGIVFNMIAFGLELVLKLYNGINDLAIVIQNKVIGAISYFAAKLDDLTGGALSTIISKVQEAVSWFMKLIGVMSDTQDAANGLNLTGVGSALTGIANAIPKKSLSFENFAGGGAEKAKKGGKGKKGEDPVKEAKKISKEIDDAWRESYQSSIGAHNDWYAKTLENLNKYKASNVNYEKDLTRLQEAEAAKRVQIVHDQIESMKSAYQSLYRSVEDMGISAASLNLSGGDKLKFDIETDYSNNLRAVQDFLQSATDAKYEAEETLRKAKASGDADELARAQAHYDSMNQLEVQAKISANEQVFELNKKREEDSKNLYAQGLMAKADLQKAQDAYDIEAYIAHLDAKNALLLSSLEGAQEYMNVFQEVQMEAHRSMISYMADAYKTLYDGLSSNMADMITGAKTAGEAFKALGKTMVGMLADFVAKKIASILIGQAMEKTASAAQASLAAVTGAAVASSWYPAAAMVSLATMGNNAAPAMAGITATVGLSKALSIPMLASGGITTGPVAAIIGEGKHDEAVLPLNRGILAPIFGDAMAYADDGESGVHQEITIYGGVNTGHDLQGIKDELAWERRRARRGTN